MVSLSGGNPVNSAVRRLLLSMTKPPNETQIVTGVAWYRPEQWQRLRDVSEDVDNLEETYEAWLQTAERMLRDGIPAGVVVERVDIDVEEVLAWCNVRGLPMNAPVRCRTRSSKPRSPLNRTNAPNKSLNRSGGSLSRIKRDPTKLLGDAPPG